MTTTKVDDRRDQQGRGLYECILLKQNREPFDVYLRTMKFEYVTVNASCQELFYIKATEDDIKRIKNFAEKMEI